MNTQPTPQTTLASTTLSIQGMTCGGCRKHVAVALGRVTGVSSVEVDLDAGEARVVHDGRATREALVAVVEAAGYRASLR
ncbi:MAG: heavy metal-associated domain-containing protein [Polyangiaceae bacterium]